MSNPMLGIDISLHEIRVVRVRRRGAGFALEGALSLPLDESLRDDPAALGEALAQSLKAAGWAGQKAVLTLGPDHGFIRYVPHEPTHSVTGRHHRRRDLAAVLARVRASLLAPAERLVFDIWSKPNGHDDRSHAVLAGAVERDRVEFCRKLAHAAGVRLVGLELRSLAALNGMMFHWHHAAEPNIAVVYLGPFCAQVGIFDPDGLVTVQSVRTSANGTGRIDPAALAADLRRVFNTARLLRADGGIERVFLAADQQHAMPPDAPEDPDNTPPDRHDLDRLAADLHHGLETPVTACSGWPGLRKVALPDHADHTSLYPAVGAALDGLNASATWFNFAHPQAAEPRTRRRRITWQPFAVAAAIALLLGLAFWFSLAQQRRSSLKALETELAGLQPQLAELRSARENWLRLRPYVARHESGSRRRHLVLLAEITRLFPSTEEAYVTRLEMTDKDAELAGEYDVLISGNVRKEVFNTFLGELRQSPMFDNVKQFSDLALGSGNAYYPYSFSVTCNVSGKEADE